MGTNKDIEELTEADFRAYERVRAGGRWNMVTDASSAMRDAGLDEATYWGVLWNYSELLCRFGSLPPLRGGGRRARSAPAR